MSYQKPLVMMNDDLAEGVYAASGAENNDYVAEASATSGAGGAGNAAESSTGGAGNGKVTCSKTGESFWSDEGIVTFSLVIPSEYVGKHIKITVTFDRNPGNVNSTNYQTGVSGNTATFETWGAESSTTFNAQGKNKGINISKITCEVLE